MRRCLVPAIFLGLLVAACQSSTLPSHPAPPSAVLPGTPPPTDDYPRGHLPLLDGWSFHKGTLDPAAAAATAAPETDWQPVTIPHTWNAKDGEDGGAPYYRGDGWYRRTVNVPQQLSGQRLFLRFEGVNRRADVYVNGRLLGSHSGGNAAFCLDATSVLHPGDNLLAVRASNGRDDIPPLQADFTFFGGIYRPVELLATSPLHISLEDHGSRGVYITTPEVNDLAAHVHVRTRVTSDRPESFPAAVIVDVSDADGRRVATQRSFLMARPAGGGGVEAGGQEVTADLLVPEPHRWDGRRDPHLYSVRVSVSDERPGGGITDALTLPLGIRTYSIDPQKGFLLNGKPYPLHGVNRHQDRQDKGWAISNEDHLQDMALIKEMGCTSIRLAHYQQAEFFYQLCDREGMVVWAEIPVVDRLGTSPGFTENARQQYIELIRQNFNHPSICFWSAGNEVDPDGGNFNRNGPRVFPWFREMAELGRKEDPTRLAAAAWRERFYPPADVTDVFGLNIYLGWYNNTFDEIESYIEKHHQNGARGKWAVTEYGAGSSIYFHSEHPVRMDHTEEYQCLYHEANWRVLKQHPEVWGKYVWNMFDFAVDGRFEGDRGGINDKGLVTYDRKEKKDAFYFYKANWSDEPTLHLAAKRFAVRGTDRITIKAYANAPAVTLTVNGQALGEKPNRDGTFVWEGVQLREGPNQAVVSARWPDGRTLEDMASWTYTPGAPQEVYEAQDEAMAKALRGGPPRVGFPRKPATPGTRPATQPGN